MVTRISQGRWPIHLSRSTGRRGKWSCFLLLGAAGLGLWIWEASSQAQQTSELPPPPPPPLLAPEPLAMPTGPVVTDAAAPIFTPAQQPDVKLPAEPLQQPAIPNGPAVTKQPADTLKFPNELLRGQLDLLKPYCPPGQGIAPGSLLCDPNMPGTACPSPEDVKLAERFVEKEFIDPKNQFTLFEGRTRLMNLKQPPTRIQIGDEKKEIVDYAIITPKQISLLGKKQGSTVLNLWFADPADKSKELVVSYLVRVIQDPEEKIRQDIRYKKLTDAINCAFPDSRICLTLVGDKLMVTGQAKDVAEAAQILRIARSNAPKQDDQKLPYNLAVNLDTASSPNARDRVRDLLDAAGPQVINLIRIPGEQQVMLKVTVAEINRSAARSIGLNFVTRIGNNTFVQRTGDIAGAATTFGAAGAAGVVGNQVFNSINQQANNLPMIIDNGRAVLAINALKNLNYARTLAEPTLATLDGQPARFQAGGSFPVPIVAGGVTQFGLQGVNFVPFGVQLSFTPFITDRDRIRLSITAEVSARDLSASTVIQGSTVSGLTTRNFSNVVELRHGETLAVAGMIQSNLGAQTSRVPFLGDIPILGRAFGFDQVNGGEQELVILVTPVLVHPLHNEEISPLPGSDLFEPSDLEFYLCGRIESRREYDYRASVRTDIHRMLKYRQCELLYISGPSGHGDAAAAPAAAAPAPAPKSN